MGPNGEVTKKMALKAFSLAIAPLPGVTPPTGASNPAYERMDGTFAIRSPDSPQALWIQWAPLP